MQEEVLESCCAQEQVYIYGNSTVEETEAPRKQACPKQIRNEPQVSLDLTQICLGFSTGSRSSVNRLLQRPDGPFGLIMPDGGAASFPLEKGAWERAALGSEGGQPRMAIPGMLQV